MTVPVVGQPAAVPIGAADSAPITAKILVADDDARNLAAVEAMLTAPGLEVVLASSGEEVLRHVLKDDFAVILLDVQMPRIDGYEAASMIRSRPRSSRVPIIFLTAYNKDELHVFRGYTAGAVDYVFKPIEPLILRSKVDVFVELYRKTEEMRRQAEEERRLLLENLRVRNEKLAAEQALRRRDEHQSLLLQALPVALYTASLQEDHRRLHFTNDRIARISGFAPDDFLSSDSFWLERVHEEDRERVTQALRGVYETGAATLEYRWRCADGVDRHFLDQAVLIRDEDGQPREFFGLWLDVTERKELESNLLHASKLESIGRLTGGIAHDFNNMLAIVIGSLELLGKALPDDERMRRRVEMAMDGARRCADLTQRLLAFSRRQSLQATVTDLRDLVPKMMQLIQRTLEDRIEIALELPDEVWPVFVDRSQLETALLNLAVNARDAMPNGGRLAVSVMNRPAHDAMGDAVEIRVSDTGVGMPAEVLERVFEPFFTTKESGKGTGLGLSMIYGFVRQSGGDVTIESAPGEGTTVRLFLPRTEGQAWEAAPQRSGSTAPGHGETVLVVEDDADVRQVAVSTLESLGYRVRESESAEAALSALENGTQIDLLFSDVSMPGNLNGADLARMVHRLRPDMPILLTSGYVDDAVEVENVELIPKPYAAEDLAQRIRSLLG
jgi:PAS domain S-box-containing protein